MLYDGGNGNGADDSGDDSGGEEGSNGEYDTTGTVEESSADEGGIFPGIPMEDSGDNGNGGDE